MRQVFLNEKCFLVKDNYIIAEILKNGNICKIKFIQYISPNGKLSKYYIKRGGFIIGWIKSDLTDCRGKDIMHQDILCDIVSIIKIIDNTSRELCY